nr:PREDICTED: receptor-transporting protein 4 isoform X3 [Rhinolophus sinicus]
MDSQLQEKVVVDVGTWEQTFQELIQQVKPRARWTLKLDKNLQPHCVAQGWKQYQQRAFGRFRCSSCRRSWASAQVQILCHMHLETRKSQGQVLMRLFAQRCRKCSRTRFEKPEFSPESTMRILNNLVCRIREKYYENSRKFREMPVILEIPLEGSHDMGNCEACILGLCIKSLQNCVTEPSKSPLSYMEIGSPSPHVGDMFSQNQTRKLSAEAKETQGRGYSCGHNRSGPCYATAGTQVPAAFSQPKREIGQQRIPGADQQGTGSQPIQVARSLPPGWTDLQPTQAVGPLPSGWVDSQSPLRIGPQVPRRKYSQVLRWAGQMSTQEACSQATQGTGQWSTKGTSSQATQGTGQQSTKETSSQATQGTGQWSTKGTSSQATQGTGQWSTKGTSSQATQESGQQSTKGTSAQATQGTGQWSTKGTSSQTTQESSQQSTKGTSVQATQGTGQQSIKGTSLQGTGQWSTKGTSSQATQESGQQSTKGTSSKATQGLGLQATRGTDLQFTWRADREATHGSGTFNGTQADWGRQETYLRRRPDPDSHGPSTVMPPNNLVVWGFVCVAALWAFVVSRYLR